MELDEKQLYVFELKKNQETLESFDYDLLCKIQEKINILEDESEIIYLLKWVVYRIKEFLPKVQTYWSKEEYIIVYKDLCGEAVCLAASLLEKMGFKSFWLTNIQDVIYEPRAVHAITIADFGNDNIYIIDPTFRQFLVKERCVMKKWKTRPVIFGAYPGYFLSLTEEGKKFGEELLNNGFFKMTDENLKIYFDAFMMYKNDTRYRKLNYGIRSGERYRHDLYLCEHSDMHEWYYPEIMVEPSEVARTLKK